MESNVTQQRVPIHGDPGHWDPCERKSAPRARYVRRRDDCRQQARQALTRGGDFAGLLFPKEDVRTDLFVPSQNKSECPIKGEASYWSIQVGERRAENAAWSYTTPRLEAASLKNHFAFEWPKMDKWMEEDEELFKHARDPYKRVDALPSKRHVRVVVDGHTVAETRRPHLVFETNHPVRYYIPQEDVRMDMLTPSATTSRCPYKGPASYWSVKISGEAFSDLVWGYMEPIAEIPKIKGLLCFFHERGCDIYVDGELMPTPQTKWAHPLRT
jgi:Uncharacterized protein conserved in bacteria